LQTTITSLRKLNTKLTVEISELRKKYAELETKNIEVNVENAKLKFANLEHKDEEKDIHLAKLDDEIKEIKQSSTNTTSRNTTTPLDGKNGQGLIQEMSSSMSSLKEKIPEVSNHATKISKTARSRKSDISSLHGASMIEISQHLAQCDKALIAEECTLEANQEEIFCWYHYGRNIVLQEKALCYKNKIGEKKAKGLIYEEVVKQLNILRKKRSQDIGLPLPDVSRDSLQILAITDHFLNKPNTDFTDNQDNSINDSSDYTNIPETQVRKQSLDLAKVSISSTPTEPTKSEVNISTMPIALPQTSVSNTSNKKLLDEKIAISQASISPKAILHIFDKECTIVLVNTDILQNVQSAVEKN
ncbi:18060_t:CDS:2, partial [Gigaspora margarita]